MYTNAGHPGGDAQEVIEKQLISLATNEGDEINLKGVESATKVRVTETSRSDINFKTHHHPLAAPRCNLPKLSRSYLHHYRHYLSIKRSGQLPQHRAADIAN